MSPKILICLEFWEGDKAQSMQLARFIADLQPGRCDSADFLFVSRFDCSQDAETIKYVARKFNVHHYRSPKSGTGWPHGCNELWFGAMEWIYHMIEAKKVPQYKAIFTIEGDGLPLQSNWIVDFSRKWDELNAIKPVYVAGAILNPGEDGEHVNGQAFFSGDLRFLFWIVKRINGAPSNCGWDYWLRKDFARWGQAQMPGLRCYWGTKTFSQEQYEQEQRDGTVWLHGVKDNSLYSMSRKKLLNV
jgi:hypothetical protein